MENSSDRSLGSEDSAYLSPFYNLGLPDSREHRTSCRRSTGTESQPRHLGTSYVAMSSSGEGPGFLPHNEGGGLAQRFSRADQGRGHIQSENKAGFDILL